jgi:hypothetical protein
MSTKSAAEKLLIKPGTTVWPSHPERLELIGPRPARPSRFAPIPTTAESWCARLTRGRGRRRGDFIAVFHWRWLHSRA